MKGARFRHALRCVASSGSATSPPKSRPTRAEHSCAASACTVRVAPPLSGVALSAAGLLAVPVAGGVAVGESEWWEPRLLQLPPE